MISLSSNLLSQNHDGSQEFSQDPKGPSTYTKAYNHADSLRLNWKDTTDFELSQKGFLAGPGPNDSIIRSYKIGDTSIVWDFTTWDFIPNSTALAPSPETVNANLWRMAKLNKRAGLFEVEEGKIYQIRGYDLSVMSIVIGPNGGYIVIDPLVSGETALAGLNLFKKALHTKRKIGARKQKIDVTKMKAVIFTHSHIDHFGGILGVKRFADANGIDFGKIQIVAPEAFMEESISENVYAGNAMTRRASYMYGDLIQKNVSAGVDAGLGKAVSKGVPAIISPTVTIDDSKLVYPNFADTGLEVEFLLAPGTEAPSEMLFYFTDYKAICMAEDASFTMHNLYTLRGAKTRNAKEWVGALTTVLSKWGNEAKIEFNSHHWPVWGKKQVKHHLETQRAMYKYIHDQTLHYANMGYDMTTTAEILSSPPDSLLKVWSSQGYYGTYNHNVKATWNLYLGWFDGNPSNLHKLPAVWPYNNEGGSSLKYVEYMGGQEAIIKRAKKAYDKGEYRWVAEVVQHVINIDSLNQDARYLVADAYEQMGYQAVSAPWRNFYLSGALELRKGKIKKPQTKTPKTFIKNTTLDMKFDMLAIMVDAHKADGKEINFRIIVKDGRESTSTAFQLKYSCLNYLVDSDITEMDFTMIINKSDFDSMIFDDNPIKKWKSMLGLKKRRIEVLPTDGGMDSLKDLLKVFSPVNNWFNLVTPNRTIPEPVNPLIVKQK